MTDSEVILELTGPLERAVGAAEVTVPLESPPCLGRVISRLVRDHPAAGHYLGDIERFAAAEGDFPAGLLVIREGIALAARLETSVTPGERLTLMPLISGG